MKSRPSIFAICLTLLLPANRSRADAPQVLLLDGAILAEVQQKVLQQPEDFAAPLEVIRREADKALREGPWSVLDKKRVPSSGDKHDYLSVGPYWWPDPSKPDGLPYIRRDGQVNPERYEYDSAGLKKTVSAVEKLARTGSSRTRRNMPNTRQCCCGPGIWIPRRR